MFKVCPTEMRQRMNYCRDYVLIANFFVMMLLPFTLISIMNTRMYKTIIQTSRRNFRWEELKDSNFVRACGFIYCIISWILVVIINLLVVFQDDQETKARQEGGDAPHDGCLCLSLLQLHQDRTQYLRGKRIQYKCNLT